VDDMIKIYDRNHTLLAEVTKHSPPSYTWTLNGQGQAQFSIGIEDKKATPENLQFFNHIEFYKDDVLKWAGVIALRSFNGSSITVNCYGYMYLLKVRRLRAKQYATMPYGDLIHTMLDEANAISETGITAGYIASGALETTRKVDNTDYVLEKMLDFVDDGNYNIDVDSDRKLNFNLRKGWYKENYLLEYGGLDDNIITDPKLDITTSDMANAVYSETSESALTATVNDEESQATYGLIEGTYSASGSIVYQSTLDGYVNSELQRIANPIQSISLSIRDSGLCPFDGIFVGDTILVRLIPYWNFESKLRILEMKHDEDTGIRDLTLGNVVYRNSKPDKKLYKG
jgi:hypothetical protein